MTETVKVLLVDDERRNLDALEAILESAPYQLLRAENADDALRLLLENDVAAIVLDIKMPGMSGFELAEVIKGTKRFRQVPILFITAYLMDDQNMIAGYGAGAVDYLTKPINPQVLRHKIAVFAELFRKTRALAELNETLEQRVLDRTADLERSETALRAADRQKDEFLAILAHELRNPLAPLSMGVEILLRHIAPDAPAAVVTTLPRMKRQLDYMVRLIDDLLDVSRITRGSLELKRERTDLAEVVRTAAVGARPFVDARRHDLVVHADTAVFAHVDGTRVTQILTNLLHNAAKFTPEGGRIEISLTCAGADAVIRVVDHGDGIAPEELERVFEMFARIDLVGTGAAAQRGLGIGLALARRLAEMHGGSLSGASAGSRQGTTFTLHLPVAPAEVAGEVTDESPAPPTAPEPLGTLRVVVIEDNPDIADTLAVWLGDMGHQVSVARTGPNGVDLVSKEHPDLVLCDLGLPELDGAEVCRRVRALALTPQPRIVALTGWGREDDRRRTTEAGFDEHLVKPVVVESLRDVLRSVARSRVSPGVQRVPKDSALSARRVLVVDDNVDSAEMVGEMLQLAGHDVRIAHDGPGALDALKTFAPDVAFLDISLPGMDGYDLAKEMRCLPGLERTMLVAMTGFSQPERKERSLASGFDMHLSKPVDSADIIACVSDGTRRSRGDT